MDYTTRPIRYGSVCSGIESASLAWEPLGWQAAWFSEIEAFPSAVLAHHWPSVPNLGDMTGIADRIRAGEIEAPDVFVGGTPCQAFSVAGMRGGLTDPRGQLTMSYVDIANAIDSRRSVRGEQPCITVWENVPGVLSDRENAFGCFLGALAGEDGPVVPPGKRWTNAGCVFGPQRAIAWRVVDAQYFGVAQRRRRVFVVSSAREGFDPTAVLFESEGVRRDIAPSREEGEEVTHPVAPSLVSSGRGVERCGETRGQDPVVAVRQTVAAQDVAGPISAAGGTAKKHGQGWGQQDWESGYCQPVVGAYSTSGAGYWRDGVGALRAREQDSHENLAVTYPILEPGKRTGKSTTDLRAGLGIGSPSDPMYTLQAGAQHGVCCVSGDIAHTLKAEGFDASEDGTGRGTPVISVHGTMDPDVRSELAHTLGRNNGGENAVCFVQNSRSEVRLVGGDGGITGAIAAAPGVQQQHYVSQNLAVRRLMPVECERLQGMPDGHTDVQYRKKQAADGPRYKAIGNSKAVPCIQFVGDRIDTHLRALR